MKVFKDGGQNKLHVDALSTALQTQFPHQYDVIYASS